MSDPQRVRELLHQQSEALDDVERELAPLISSRENGEPLTAEDSALAAYALGSLLFATAKSEGADSTPVMPQLERVKEMMAKVDKRKPSTERNA